MPLCPRGAVQAVSGLCPAGAAVGRGGGAVLLTPLQAFLVPYFFLKVFSLSNKRNQHYCTVHISEGLQSDVQNGKIGEMSWCLK